ncbi:unnamed protein product [Staurois parvus]|uniref:Uncharacterized protein n=1 Tax=Staurois parvus TaxID=386267 RepID=A0ABN9BHN0_9NEOB|nr:unnamed protein product [Staurois parvus]
MGSAVQRSRQKDGQASQGLNRRRLAGSGTMQRSATEDSQDTRYRGSWETPRH